MRIFLIPLYVSFFIPMAFTACNTNNRPETVVKVVRDTTITVSNAFSPKFLDSITLERYLRDTTLQDSVANRLRLFYAQRNYQYAWFTDSGLAEYSLGFGDMLNNYVSYSKDSSMYSSAVQAMIDTFMVDPKAMRSADDMLKTELLLSRQFFRYAYRVYEGRNSLDQMDLGWFIPKKKVNPVAILDSIVKNNGFHDIEPLNPQYNLLKNALIKYDAMQPRLDSLQPVILFKGKTTLDSVQQENLLQHLFLLGDLHEPPAKRQGADSVLAALTRFQGRHGLAASGKVHAATLAAMNLPAQQRINQMLINLERLKWVPLQPSTDYFLINIPEYKLHVYEKGRYQWNMNVVVGSTTNSTVIFAGTLKNVVFSPYWNVPQSIIKKEILPGIKRNKNYLASHNMEWNNGQVRQKPGPRNSLGLVKFLFPNSYSIYLHDTPSKSLFNESSRAFSHGCIRVAEPEKLADFILRHDSSWNDSKIKQAMHAGTEKYVTVKENIPVFIGYFTAWVDRSGQLNFRNDIYGHDKKMAEKLFIRN